MLLELYSDILSTRITHVGERRRPIKRTKIKLHFIEHKVLYIHMFGNVTVKLYMLACVGLILRTYEGDQTEIGSI